MRILVIGGSGHIGSYLVPRLVRAGHQVVSMSRGQAGPYTDGREWGEVIPVAVDRGAAEADGSFGRTVLAQRADVVIDLICFTEESAAALVTALRGGVDHLLHCGSVWRYGASRKLPITEDSACTDEPHDEYGIHKARIADLLKRENGNGGLITTSIHPGHIVGPGWHPIGPVGNVDETLWTALSSGRTIDVPGSGTETLHHVHADDVAQAFERAVANRDAAAGEDFNIVAPTALNVRGYIQIASGWFGHASALRSVSWDRFRELTTPEHADVSRSHLERSQVFSIEKARARLGYEPRYEPEAAILESVRWLIEQNRLPVRAPLR